MFTIPKTAKSNFAKSPLKLNVAVDNLNSTVAKFTDGTYDIYSDGVYVKTAPQAKLNLVFPDLSNDNNQVNFDLRFNGLTIMDIQTYIYFYELRDRLDETSEVKYIQDAIQYLTTIHKIDDVPTASIFHNTDGTPMFTLKEFRDTFELPSSTSKLYSILRENSTEFLRHDLQGSLLGKQLIVKSYFNDKLNNYTICSPNHKPRVSQRQEEQDVPVAKAYSRRRTQVGNPFA
tara:strand:- start:300 stop:992 length:693 start_codon:yes stop_codon:yes gene_type:complete